MTICIAAVCDMGHAIVLASDREIGIGFTSAEFHDGKFGPLYRDWSIGISGTVSNATDVFDAARHRLSKMETADAYGVQCAVEDGYSDARLHLAERRFLANRGWTLKEFKDCGAAKLPPATYANIDASIAFLDFNTDLIVAGFDDSSANILSVTNPGVCVDHSKIGFWAVGSGATAAQVTLFTRNYSWKSTPEEAAYYLLEAKIAAERASGVGPTTDIFLVRKGHMPVPIQDATKKQMRAICDELKPKDFTRSHADALREANEFKIFEKSK